MRIRAGALGIAVAAASLLPALPAPASPEAGLSARTNRERATRGLPVLRTAADLSSAAERAAAAMASDGSVRHNRWRRWRGLGPWASIRENVGLGANESRVYAGFMQSMTHRANLLHPHATHIGVGAVRADGALYVSVLFGSPRREAAPRPPSPRRTRQARHPARAAAPEPKPEPEPEPPAVTVCMLVSLMSLEQPAGPLPLPRSCRTSPLP